MHGGLRTKLFLAEKVYWGKEEPTWDWCNVGKERRQNTSFVSPIDLCKILVVMKEWNNGWKGRTKYSIVF